MTLYIIVPAAGVGARMNADRPKQYLTLAGEPLMKRTLERLSMAFEGAELVLGLSAGDPWFDSSWLDGLRWRRAPGGNSRADTVRQALDALKGCAHEDDLVLVHDVARPCVTVADLLALKAAAQASPDGALLATPVADTMKRAGEGARVLRTESRERLYHALTPQGFRYGLLSEALYRASQHGNEGITDEASAVEALGRSPQLVPGRRDNIKVTHPEDLALAEAILAAQSTPSTDSRGMT
ncbi:2-C-methyl-D-erythritol 4-phosphate cytidylyltransferase [Larsenimonas suaedae]|uniref:2-C-methyl-D-erythritol 4-phosphate cytidylyltransferase n=1 Tax=Larsenimonas suaedae TaxID=1851019 RepID=A0ABU1GYB2_9GAMM|nr:2-C-methyl-D-erythritol 4-phosphate cytidylyltransferase [Larsenimonas suaedae]MCM2973005.1 2-C-methyl-D-erythritol 4-phosphate cytidylyltransferase [Larsenimonas suaedae]MDR5896442.1 2-C-methyl-D-erythritol 4-phosphate cytidylyltransferase [Larsenimonas suaedae]